MITESAVVTRRDGKLVELELQRNSTCGQCELSKGCGTGALGRLLGHRSKPILIETDHDLKPGDRLQLGLSESALVKASLTIYGLPLLGMVHQMRLSPASPSQDSTRVLKWLIMLPGRLKLRSSRHISLTSM
jgi:sigma-E factor negative regulatory protein RseC